MTLKKDMFHIMAVKCVNGLNRYAGKEMRDRQKMVLGVEILFHNIPKLLLMLILATLLGILPQTILIWLPFACIRRYAAGLHASNNITCTLATLFMFVAMPYIIVTQGISINVWVLLAIFGLVNAGLYKYAPADTNARPILGKVKRIKLRKKSVMAGLCMLALALALRSAVYYALISMGGVYALITVLPVTYKILGRSINNYEQYE